MFVLTELSKKIVEIVLISEGLELRRIAVNDDNDKNERVNEILKHCHIALKRGLELGVKEGDKSGGDKRAVDITHTAKHDDN